MKRIYLDYASLTPIDSRVMREIIKYSKDEYSNSSSLYQSGQKANQALADAKNRVAKVLHTHSNEIIFTSGGTESNRLILDKFAGKRVMISSIEHSSIIKNNHAVLIPVNKEGIIDLNFIKNNINRDIALISVMIVNNEIGTIQPIRDIAKIIRNFNKENNTHIFLHTDASQATMYIPINTVELSTDFITLDGNKMYGPRGSGILFVKRNTINIDRSGTENLPAIMGLTHAFELAEKNRDKETKRIHDLKKYFISKLLKIDKNIKINGSLEKSSPHILNISIPGIDNEYLLFQLDAKGIEISTKSACLRSVDESYVLKAIGVSSNSAVRFSFGRETKKTDLDRVLSVISRILHKKE